MERRVRLGDVIDDYCTRCRRLMNHGIVGMVGDDVAKVRCNTCQSEHAYKHGRLPKRRRGETDRLFAEVLRGITGTDPDAEEPATEEADNTGPDEKRAGEEEDEDAGDADTPTESDEAPPEPADAPPPADEDHPAHGVRRRLFTIRRHSGGKAPVEGVSTDIGRPGGPVTGNRPEGQGGRRGGRPQHGAPGGQGGHGGRWPKRRGRRR